MVRQLKHDVHFCHEWSGLVFEFIVTLNNMGLTDLINEKRKQRKFAFLFLSFIVPQSSSFNEIATVYRCLEFYV